MKKFLLILMAAILSVPCIFAQGQKDKAKMREDLQQFKIDFLAKEMSLTEKEKAEFTPLYKEYDKARRDAGAEVWKFERQMKKNNNPSEADYKKLAELQQKAREKDIEIVKNFDAKLESFLSAKQIYEMHQGEGKFFEKMKEMHKKHGDGGPKHGKPDSKPGGKNHKGGKDSQHMSDSDVPPSVDL